jgi:hypothetical protein
VYSLFCHPEQSEAKSNGPVKRILAVVLLIIATAASYAPAVRNGFVWDDTALVLRDPLIRSWRLIPEGFNHYLFVDATPSDFYRPMQRLTYTIEYALFTARPGPYHITNIALHAAAAITLMFFAEALLGAFGCDPRRRTWIALIAALVWAIHPVHSAAVIYVSGRADPLAALFGFIGCYLVLRFLVRPKREAILCLFAAAVAFLCSALSKETGLLFPVLMALVLTLLNQRRSLIWLGVVAISVSVVYLSLRLPAEHNPAPHLGANAPASVRPITIARAAAEYTGLLIFPLRLHMERDVRSAFSRNLYANTSVLAGRELQTLIGIIILVGLLIWVLRARRRDPLLFALLLCALITYLPISGLIRLNASVAEHWIYVPSSFLFLAAVTSSSRTATRIFRSRLMRGTATVLCATWIVFLGTRTFLRTFDWKDQRTFLERTIAAGGGSARMLINLGALESGENHLDLARKYLEDALKMEPNQPFALIDLAAVSIKQNDFRGARDLLARATVQPLVAGQAHELLVVLENKENGHANLLRMRLAAHTGFSDWAIEKRYIKLLAETGAMGAAIHELQTCLQTEWYRAESWQLLGQLLTRSGQPKAAAEARALANSYDVHLSARPAVL